MSKFVNFEPVRPLTVYATAALAVAGGIAAREMYLDSSNLVNVMLAGTAAGTTTRVKSIEQGFRPAREIPSYADEASAIAAGLPYGSFYRLDATPTVVRVLNDATARKTQLAYAGFSPYEALPEYADNTAALAGGLSVGDYYIATDSANALAVVS